MASVREIELSAGRIRYRDGGNGPVVASWLRPLLTSGAVRRDTARFLGAIDHRDTVAASETLRGFDKPVLLVWPSRAPYFLLEHAHRWTRDLPDARLVDAGDSYTFVSEDQPEPLTTQIVAFTQPNQSSEPKVDIP